MPLDHQVLDRFIHRQSQSFNRDFRAKVLAEVLPVFQVYREKYDGQELAGNLVEVSFWGHALDSREEQGNLWLELRVYRGGSYAPEEHVLHFAACPDSERVSVLADHVGRAQQETALELATLDAAQASAFTSYFLVDSLGLGPSSLEQARRQLEQSGVAGAAFMAPRRVRPELVYSAALGNPASHHQARA